MAKSVDAIVYAMGKLDDRIVVLNGEIEALNDVDIVELNVDGKCPRCGADYGPDKSEPPKPRTGRTRADGSNR